MKLSEIGEVVTVLESALRELASEEGGRVPFSVQSIRARVLVGQQMSDVILNKDGDVTVQPQRREG